MFVKLANVGPIASGFYRVFFGAVFLFIFVYIKFRKQIKITKKQILLSFMCGLIFAIDLSFWHKSILSVGPGLATVLANFQVFFLVIFGMFVFKEKLNKVFFVSVFFAIGGMFMLIGPGWNDLSLNWKMGIVFGILTAISYSIFILLIRKLQTEQNFANVVFNMALVSFFSAIIMAIEMRTIIYESFIIPDKQSFFALFFYGFFGQVLGWVIISKNLSKLKVSVSSLIMLLQPSLSFLWDILFFFSSNNIP